MDAVVSRRDVARGILTGATISIVAAAATGCRAGQAAAGTGSTTPPPTSPAAVPIPDRARLVAEEIALIAAYGRHVQYASHAEAEILGRLLDHHRSHLRALGGHAGAGDHAIAVDRASKRPIALLEATSARRLAALAETAAAPRAELLASIAASHAGNARIIAAAENGRPRGTTSP